jgi:hypothetical protein
MKKETKSPTCQWCGSTEIHLVPVSSLVNLKLGDMNMSQVPHYQKLWQQQGWPVKLHLCWVCRQNCELAWQGINVWLCPGCRKCLVYLKEPINSNTVAYSQLPINCSCGWKKKRLSKRGQKKIADQAIKSGVSYQKTQKTYFAKCSFCNDQIIGKQKDKGVKNRNQVRFWTDKVSEERLICNGCLRENREFQKLLLSKYRKRWWAYKSRGQI